MHKGIWTFVGALTQMQLCLAASCPCQSGEYCWQDRCTVCPENSVSLPGSSSSDECLCKPGYFDYTRDGVDVCLPCPPGTYKDNWGSVCHRCPREQRGVFSQQASISVDNCSVHSAVDVPRRTVGLVKAYTETRSPFSAELKRGLKEGDGCGRTGCCAGSFYHDEYAVTGNGVKIELLDNGSAVTSNAFPFQVSLENMRISSDRTFAVGVFWWYDYATQLYGSSRFYRLNLTTGELIAKAGLGVDLDPYYGARIDGPGANSTLDELIVDVALSPDDSFALVVGWYSGTVRKIDVSSGFVTTIPQAHATGVDIAPDGSFAILIDYTTLSKIDLFTNKVTFLASIEGFDYGLDPKVRISSDGLFIIFFRGCKVYQLFLGSSSPILIAGGEPDASGYCSGYSDGPGSSSQFGYIGDLVLSNTGRFVLLFDAGNYYRDIGYEGLKIRRIDLRSMQVSTLVSGQILRPKDIITFLWGSLSITGSCDLCPPGSYSAGSAGSFHNVSGASACWACPSGAYSAAGATSCTQGTEPLPSPTPTTSSACGAEEQCFVHSVASANAELRLSAPSPAYVPVSITVWVAGAAAADKGGLAVWMAWENATTVCAIGPAETALTWRLLCGGPGDALYLTLPYALRGAKGVAVKVCMRRAQDALDLGAAVLTFVDLTKKKMPV